MGKKVHIFIVFVMLVIGFLAGMKMTLPPPRTIETGKMEQCLELYIDYRVHNDQDLLASKLVEIGLTPLDFQKIIDRFIYYRTMKSSMEQAMKLLSAFRAGFDINAAEIHSISGMASEPFRLDAEVLAVFEEKPDLVKRAFEG